MWHLVWTRSICDLLYMYVTRQSIIIICSSKHEFADGHDIHIYIIAAIISIYINRKGLMLPSRFSEGSSLSSFSFLFFFFFACVQTAFKGYCLPASCTKHTITGSGSSQREIYSLLQLDPVLPCVCGSLALSLCMHPY